MQLSFGLADNSEGLRQITQLLPAYQALLKLHQ